MRIGIWGDSIGYGASDTENGGWVFQLQNFVWSHNNDCSVYNLSISGDNSGHLRTRFTAEFAARSPEIVIFAIGVNDSQYLCDTGEERVSLEETRENLEWLYERAMESAKEVIFVGITQVDDLKVQPIPWATEKCYSNSKTAKYDKIVEEVAANKGAHFISVRDVVDPPEMPDGLHPGSEGHKKMFEIIRQFLVAQKLLN